MTVINTKSIAVLPFVSRSPNKDDEYFSEGITEEIINALTGIHGLKVIARNSSFSFRGQAINVRKIGQQLGVHNLLEGSVRRLGNRIRITAKLINTSSGLYLWSKNFDRQLDDIFDLQDEISLLIADQIRENFGHFNIPSVPTGAPTQYFEAYELWLKGSYFLKRKDFQDIKQAIKYFNESVKVDPNYAQAYASLGEAYIHAAGFGILPTQKAHELAKVAAQQAIKINAKEAIAYKVLATIYLFYDWNWPAAIQAYEKAVANGLAPQNDFISYYYIFIEEDYDQAILLGRQILESDPLHVISHWQLGLAYYFAQRFEEAISAFNGALALYPEFGEALRFKGLALGYLGRYEKGLNHIEQALKLTEGAGLANWDWIIVKVLMGEKEEALARLSTMEAIDASDPAIIYALLNMPEQALDYLEKAYQERSVMLATLKTFWVWDNLRTHQRFQSIYKAMQFPATPLSTEHKLPEASSSERLTSEEVMRYQALLKQQMETEQVYIDPKLNLRILAKEIDLHPNKLSWLLNEHYFQNFNEYVNSYRLEHFKIIALDTSNSHLTLLALAYESGFNSKTVFNTFFKKREGMPPRTWMKQAQQK